MVATYSSMPDIGSVASDFCLKDSDGKVFSLSDFNSNPFMIMFICNHCPYVIHIAEKISEIAFFARKKGVNCVAINSNDIANYPQDSPENMKKFSNKYSFNFPYLFDETQEVAKSYKAECTPDFFLYGENNKLFYRGQMDDSRPGSDVPVTGNDLTEAIRLVVEKKDPPKKQKPSMGCNIKWFVN